MAFRQVDCFINNIKNWKLLGINPNKDTHRYYSHYSKLLIFIVIVLYDILLTINFLYLPKQLQLFIEESLFYFMELAVTSKVFTFIFYKKKILKLLEMLESDLFKPDTVEESAVISKAKIINVTYWKIVAGVSLASYLTHTLTPLISHVLLPIKLELTLSAYSFFSDETIQTYIYPLYFYQISGMFCHMWYNVNIDTFFMGVMVLAIAQLDILNTKMRNLTKNLPNDLDTDKMLNQKFNATVNHYNEVVR